MNIFRMLKQVEDGLKLNEGNRIILGCRYLEWDYRIKRWSIWEISEDNSDLLCFVEDFTSFKRALYYLCNPFE